MTKPKSECRSCGRIEGHYLNCPASPRPDEIVIPAFEPLAEDSVCQEDGCDDPVKSAATKYCTAHMTTAARNARAYRKRTAKDKEDV